MSNSIVVVGSCMMDFVCYAPRLPAEGETIHGTKFATNFGGKGANQCVAAAKLGGNTTMVARGVLPSFLTIRISGTIGSGSFVNRVGDDIWGDKYIQNFKDSGINYKYVQKTHNYSNGIAQITVSDAGANQIVIVAGANLQLSVQDLDLARKEIEAAAVVVCQLETIPEVALKSSELCKGISILNGAPAISEYEIRLITVPSIFCVNEIEAAVFAGIPVKTIEDAKEAIKILLNKGCNCVILTMGSQGAVFASQDQPTPEHVDTPKVDSVDSTGAGDAFIGALAHLLANRADLSMKVIIGAACHVAADCCRRPGTQNSYPDSNVLDEYLQKFSCQ